VRPRAFLPTLLYLAGLILLYSLMPFGGKWWYVTGLIGFASVVAVIPFIIRRLGRLQVSERPIYDALQVLVLSVTILVLGFAALYESMSMRQGNFSGIDNKVDAGYFTVTTLSTVGYGDIHATGRSARLIVTFQIIFNLIFLGGTVRLIANVSRERHKTLHGDTLLKEVVDRDEPITEVVTDEEPDDPATA
jgi:voltage-gated potassium channel